MQVTDGTREDASVRAGKLVDILDKVRNTKLLTEESEIGEIFDVLLGDKFEQGWFGE
jgi:hypothetical protein